MKPEEMKLERKKMSELKPADYNPREIRDVALEGLAGSIDKFGMIVPIIWNKRSGNIVGGHQRFKVLSEKGVEETDVVVVDLDNNEEITLNITMNNPSARGTFTKSVVGLLEKAKVDLDDDFKSIGLEDMLNYLGKYKFDKPPSSAEKKKKSSGDGTKKDGMRCPKCLSVWNKDTGEIKLRSGVSNV